MFSNFCMNLERKMTPLPFTVPPILLLNLYKYVQHVSVALSTYSPASHLLSTFSSFQAVMEQWSPESPTAHGLHEPAPQTLPHVTVMTANAPAVWGEGRGKRIFLSIWVTDLGFCKVSSDGVKQDCESRFFSELRLCLQLKSILQLWGEFFIIGQDPASHHLCYSFLKGRQIIRK